MYDSVLVPIDGSDVSEEAFEHAIGLAKQYGATLHIVHTVDPDTLPTSVSSISLEEEFEEMGEDLVERAREEAEDEGLTVETEIVSGSPEKHIVDYAAEHGIDLIVIGTHGRRGLDRVLSGSVTEKVVRNADVPVLVIHRGDDGEE
ncbi:universal stress protein [Halarchaeum acidiphilum MH1-52-1]|uniref:Universal stress protein n=1 Tax=Halarchaeum acidiphilum MH1-52-1 TaxID=1261545 RepID=U3A7K0_9EURY|nr:universal stress protein [Halarchaeum acidiphilum]GAD53664.1 universal stress protein [Halarchaeum acidiphilum MH1-52-1]